jgi:enamine deaminase RidA (YjgF/YER057c/UK114 family)
MKRFFVSCYGSAQIYHAPIVRAGKWIFCSGLRAQDATGQIDSTVTREGRPLDTPPKAQREATFIFDALQKQLKEVGSDLSKVVRLDQYYPDWRAVDPYHCARKVAMKGAVSPSTSVLVNQLLLKEASMDIQAIAVSNDSEGEPKSLASTLSAPKESGYSHCVRAGDLIFVAGQLARDSAGNIAAQAQVPEGQLWKGTRIKLETDYLIRERLIPALQSSGSSLDLILKAQVYLSHESDFPAFWQVWQEAFGDKVPPTTVIPVRHPAFGTEDARIEVNLIAAHESARDRIVDIECDVELIGPNMVAGRKLDDLLFCSGLMAINADGLIPQAQTNAKAPFFDDTVAVQTADILAKAKKIFAAAGTSLDYAVRATHFHRDLHHFRSVYNEWRQEIGDVGLPFSAVEVDSSFFIPGAELIVDLIGYIPPKE